MSQVIVIGGGLSGLSAAHTVLQNGGSVLVLDKNAFLGGNSTKATSGINGTLTKTQIDKKIADSPATFYEDTVKSAKELVRPELVKVLTYESGPAVDWLQDKFALDLSLVARLGGHSFPRTHRGPERFPGMTITYALMEALEEICKKEPHRAKLISKAKVLKLHKDADGSVVGVDYEIKGGKKGSAYGPVIIASGGYGSDFKPDSLIAKYRPELIKMKLATTNGNHCTGDGIKLAEAIGGATVDMKQVQVHPTGLIDPKEPDNGVKFLAAEALRGVGGLLLTAEGKRFCDELGHRDYVTGEMWKHKAPFRLVLNTKAASDISWHVKHYTGRGLMKTFTSAGALAAEMGIDTSVLAETFNTYNKIAATKKDPFGKKYFAATPFTVEDTYHVAFVTPVVHYTMGGLEINGASAVISTAGAPIPGLWAAGEVCGGIHGVNRLGGSSLLDCVVFGRVAGASASNYLLRKALAGGVPAAGSAVSASGINVGVKVTPGSKKITLDISWDGKSAPAAAGAAIEGSSAAPPPAGTDFYDGGAKSDAPAAAASKVFSYADVAKHNTKTDCWVIVNGEVLDVTDFLEDHPGGAAALLLFAGKDASEEFNMLHKPDVIAKYAPECVIGTIEGGAKAHVGAKL